MMNFHDLKKVRTMKIENIPENISITTLIDSIKDCEIETIKKENNIYFLTFFEYFIFYTAYNELKEKIADINKNIKISICYADILPNNKLLAFQAGASRSVYFHNIDDSLEETFFSNLASQFGEIENLKFNKEKKHVQIRFNEFDHCMAFMEHLCQAENRKNIENLKFGFHRAKSNNKIFHTNRTLYLGNIQTEILPEDIFKFVFFDAVYTLRFLRDRKCAFLTFINPHSAECFLEASNKQPVFIKKHRIKITHGNNSLIPLPAILSLYNHNASRSIEVDDIKSNCQFENLESRKVFPKSVKYSFYSMNAALHAMEMLRQSYKDNEIRYTKDDSAIISSAEYMVYMMYKDGIC